MNEALLMAAALADIGLVLLAYYRSRSWLLITIVVNLLLITILGPKIVSLWDFSTNVGNVYYAAAFFAIYLLLENESKAYVFRTMLMSSASVIFFSVLLMFALGTESDPSSAVTGQLLDAALGTVPRIALASLFGFVVAQSLNIALYASVEDEADTGQWWMRHIVLLMVAQLVDSIIFFTIAFWGVVATDAIVESMMVGYAIKVAIGIACAPLVYMNRRRESVLT